MTGRNRRNRAQEIGMTCCRNLRRFVLAALGASGFGPRSGHWASSAHLEHFWRAVPPAESLASILPGPMAAFARRCNLYQPAGRKSLHPADCEFLADAPGLVLLLRLARAISCAPGPATRALLPAPNQDSASEENIHIVGPGQ